MCALFLACRSLDFGLRFFFRLADDGRDGLQFFASAQSPSAYAHGIAADARISFTRGPDHLALGRDQHQFVFIGDSERADDVAGFFAGLHRDDAFAAARLLAVIVERRPFADPVFARDQQHGVRIHDRDRDDVVRLSPAEFPRHRPCCVPDRAIVLRENEDSFLPW